MIKTEKQADSRGININLGVNSISLYYNALDFKEVVERISESGIEKLGWVHSLFINSVFINDPDGIFIEIVGPFDK